ncbi:KRFJ protein, partial [Sitta europaea]|nr:KRFJ protein [Sitta europaea]
MSPFHELCLPGGLACPEPFAVTRNDTCIIRYPDTVLDIAEPHQPPYCLIYPGPTLTTFPQQTLVGSTALLEPRALLGSPPCRGFGGTFGGRRGSPVCGGFWGRGAFPPHLWQLFCCGTCRPA